MRLLDDITQTDIYQRDQHFTNDHFQKAKRRLDNETTGPRKQMFGKAIDLSWEDCHALARDGHVMVLE